MREREEDLERGHTNKLERLNRHMLISWAGAACCSCDHLGESVRTDFHSPGSGPAVAGRGSNNPQCLTWPIRSLTPRFAVTVTCRSVSRRPTSSYQMRIRKHAPRCCQHSVYKVDQSGIFFFPEARGPRMTRWSSKMASAGCR